MEQFQASDSNPALTSMKAQNTEQGYLVFNWSNATYCLAGPLKSSLFSVLGFFHFRPAFVGGITLSANVGSAVTRVTSKAAAWMRKTRARKAGADNRKQSGQADINS